MPLPIEALPAVFAGTQFTVNAGLCAKAIPSVIAFMEARAALLEYLVRESDGLVSDEMARDLQALTCLDASSGGNGGSTCPNPHLVATVTAAPTQLTLAVSGSNLSAGWAWSLYRKGEEAEAWPGSPQYSGTTASATVTQVDAGLANGEDYFYKMVVQKPGCPAYTVEMSGTPDAITVNPAIQVEALQVECAWVRLRVTTGGGGVTSAMQADFYVRTQTDGVWSEWALGQENVGSSTCPGGAGVCFTAAIDVTGTYQQVQAKAVVKQGAATTEVLATAMAVAYPPGPPVLEPRVGAWLAWSANPGCGTTVAYRLEVAGLPTGGQWVGVYAGPATGYYAPEVARAVAGNWAGQLAHFRVSGRSAQGGFSLPTALGAFIM